MPGTLEERVAYLEGKVEEHSRGFGELREMVIHLDQKVDRFRDELAGRIEALDQRLNGRIDALDQRIEALDQRLNGRIDALDQRIDALDQRLNGRIDALDQKLSTHFTWLVGIQVAVLLAVVGALIAK